MCLPSFLQRKCLVFLSFQCFPAEDAVFQSHVAVMTAFLWQGDGSWIEVGKGICLCTCRNVRMSMKKDISCLEKRRSLQIILVTVSDKNHPVLLGNQTVVCKDWKRQNHLIHFAVAVSPHTEDA